MDFKMPKVEVGDWIVYHRNIDQVDSTPILGVVKEVGDLTVTATIFPIRGIATMEESLHHRDDPRLQTRDMRETRCFSLFYRQTAFNELIALLPSIKAMLDSWSKSTKKESKPTAA